MVDDAVIPESRCGYVHDSGWGKDSCCVREVTYSDRCFWHAPVKEKSADEISDALAKLDGFEKTDRSLERLDGAYLEAATLDDSVNFEECNLTDANFSGANLTWSDYPELEMPWDQHSGEQLDTPSFSGADLKHAEFSGGELPQTSFVDADLHDTRFVETGLSNAKLNGADLQSAIFARAYMGSAQLRGASLAETDFTNARLSNAKLNGAFAERTVFSNTDFSGADLRGAALYSAVLSDVRLDDQTEFGYICPYDAESRYYPPFIPREANLRNYSTSNAQKAAWVYRRLERLHEANALIDRAWRFHRREKRIQRSQYLTDRNLGAWSVSVLNKILTKDGVSLSRVLSVSTALILGSAFLYPFVGGVMDGGTLYQFERPGDLLSTGGLSVLGRTLYFSIITFTTIGYANVAPHGSGSRILVGIESLMGAILIALFVFVLGRRVAR